MLQRHSVDEFSFFLNFDPYFVLFDLAYSDNHAEKFNFLKSILREIDDNAGKDAVDGTSVAANTASPIFGNICLPFLEDKCYVVCGCMNDHKLPSKEQVQRNLELSERKDVDHAHNDYLIKYDKLLTEYFAVFTKYYGRKKYPEYLRRSIVSIADKRDTTYFKDILNGLLVCGLQYQTAIDLLIIEMPATVDQDDRFNLLWQLILDTRNKKVREHLQSFEANICKESNGTGNQFINALLEQLIISEFDELKMFCVRLLKSCAITTLHRIDMGPLKQFVYNLSTSSKIDADAITRRLTQFGKKID